MNLVLTIILIYLSIWTAYLAVYSFASMFYNSSNGLRIERKNNYLILIPAYKEDAVILDTVVANLRQLMDNKRYKLVVIADQLNPITIAQIKAMEVEVIQVNFEKSTKAKSINYALSHCDTQGYSHVVILDADNEMHPDFLNHIEQAMCSHDLAIQGHRTAKNLDSTTAILDAVNEEIGNHIFRKGHQVMGLSAALIGSGMVFQLDLFKRLMESINDTAGEDKMLEFALLEKKVRVKYCHEALVYDQKVSNNKQFSGQRERWVTARLYFLRSNAGKAFKRLIRGDFDYFNKWLQFLLPQKILLIGYVCVFWVIAQLSQTLQWQSTALLTLLILTFLLAIPRAFYSLRLLRAIISLPMLMVRMLFVLVKAPFVDPAKFVVTEKGNTANG